MGAATGMGLLFCMLKHLAVCKGFFTIKPSKNADGVHTQEEVDAFVFKCIEENVFARVKHASGIGQMWCPQSDMKPDPKGALNAMKWQAERYENMGYLTPSMLAVLDTRLYCAVRAGVNNTFGIGSGPGITSNQPKALLAHDEFLWERARFHYK